MERIFQILAIVLIALSAFFLWNGSTDGLFIAAVAGAVCFFLSVRFQVGDRLKHRERQESETKIVEDTDADASDKPQSRTAH